MGSAVYVQRRRELELAIGSILIVSEYQNSWDALAAHYTHTHTHAVK